jgi:hypothetical protein
MAVSLQFRKEIRKERFLGLVGGKLPVIGLMKGLPAGKGLKHCSII